MNILTRPPVMPSVLIAVCFVMGPDALRAQDAPPKRPAPVIGATSQEVMLDVVARDKRGRLVKNLRVDEIQVSDDGVVRKIRSFRSAGTEDPESAAQKADPTGLAAAKAALNANPDPGLSPSRSAGKERRLITMVFDQLLPPQRPFAKQAALELVKSSGRDVLLAVFRIDQRLDVLASFTNDQERVKNAIEGATNPSYSLNIDEESRIARNQATAALAEVLLSMKTSTAASGQFSTTDQRLAQTTLNMLQFNDASEQKQQSRAQLVALWALVKQQKQLPGRKTIVYFTGGMNIPPEHHDLFNTIVADANSANVTVYAIHAGGIPTYLGNTSGGALLEQAGASSRTNMVDRTGIVSVDQAQVFDRSEGSVLANTQNALEILTHDTGGFYAFSNDFRGPVRRVLEEVNFHYELTYSPGIEKYDGHLRRILVTVSRPDVRVLTRSGYYAMPPTNSGQDLQPYESPMLSALSMPPASFESKIPFRAEAKLFGGKTSLVVDVPIEQMALTSDPAAGSFSMHMSVLGLFKDSDGGIVQKVSRDVPAKGKLENLESTRAGHFIFTQHVELPPGSYTLETAVFDRESLKIGVKKQAVVIPAQAAELSLSSLSLVRTVAPAGQEFDSESPYQFSGAKVTPELNRTVKGGPGGTVGMYLVVYGQKGQPAKLTIDFLQDGKVVARSEPPIPNSTGDGRIPVLAQVPIHTLKPGAYEVHARVFQAGRGAEQRMKIDIE